jgi:hypothetical protein
MQSLQIGAMSSVEKLRYALSVISFFGLKPNQFSTARTGFLNSVAEMHLHLCNASLIVAVR